MDSQDFQGWLSAAGELTRPQRREALAVLSGRSAAKRRRRRSSSLWTRPGVARIVRGGGSFARHGAWSAALPVQGLWQDLQRADGHAAVGPAPQGALAVVRRLACGGGDGEGVGGALRCGGEHGVPLASPLSGGGAGRFGVLKGIVEADETYLLESRKGTRKLGRKARRRGGRTATCVH